jgi:hypothetical protein
MIVADQVVNIRRLEQMVSEAGYPGISAKKYLNYERIKC